MNTEILAGLSRHTVWRLKFSEDDGIIIDAGGPDENGKYAGWILCWDGRPLVSTGARFDSSEEAIDYMKKVGSAAKAFEEPPTSAAYQG